MFIPYPAELWPIAIIILGSSQPSKVRNFIDGDFRLAFITRIAGSISPRFFSYMLTEHFLLLLTCFFSFLFDI